MAMFVATLANPEPTGAPKMAQQYLTALLQAGHRVVVCVGPLAEGVAATIPAALHQAGAEVREVGCFQRPPSPRAAREVADIARHAGADCLVGFQQRDRAIAAYAAAQADARCVISAQNQHRFHGPGPVRAIKRRLFGRCLRRHADLVICTCQAVSDEVVNGFGVSPDRARILPNGIDVASLTDPDPHIAQRLRRELGIADEQLMLLNVGRLAPQKGQDVLLSAFAPLAAQDDRAALVLVGAAGDAPAEQRHARQLRGQVDRLGLAGRVIFAGPRADVPSLLAAADLYVHPARWEGWPLAVVEAMAAGLPVVSTDCFGRPEGFVDGEAGWLVPTGQADPLRQAIQRAVGLTSAERGRMGKAARQVAWRYDIAHIAERFVELAVSVLDENKQGNRCAAGDG
ncbi:MAG: glycosyltransferase family 4 protein [Planctomycetota bacterium]